MLETTHIHKSAEVDDFDRGCIGGCTDQTISHTISAETPSDAARQLCDFAGVDFVPENYQLDNCEERGRIDVFSTENGDGFPATDSELADWKKGRIQLYYATYTAYFQRVTREVVALV